MREIARTHARSIIPIGAAVAVGVIVLIALAGLYAQLLGNLAAEQLAELMSAQDTIGGITLAVLTPVAIVAVVVTLVWAGLAVQLATAAMTGRRVSTGNAALVALRRAPRALAVVLLVAVSVIGALLLAPVFLVVGILGLLLSAPAATSRFADRWPSRTTLIAMAVPFGVAVLIAVRWSLAPASVWLADSGIRAALRDSSARVRSHEAVVALSLAIAAVLTLAATEALVALVALGGWGDYPEFVARIIAIVLIGPLLFVASAVHYRRGGVANGEETPTQAPAVSGVRARRTRIAIAVVAALMVPLVVSVNPAPANAVTGALESSVGIETDPDSPLPADQATDIQFFVYDPYTAEGDQPSGEITITIDGVVQPGPHVLAGYGFGSPYVISRSFTAGSHTIAASYAGDENYAASSESITISAGYPVSLTLEAATATAVYGAANYFTATVSTTGAAPTGSVEFFASFNGAPLASIGLGTVSGGVATLDAASLVPGSYSVSASYLGDATHLPASTTPVPLTVSKASTTTSFSVTPTTPSAAGATLTAHVTVATATSSATPTGTANVYLNGGGASLGNGTLTAGTADIAFSLPPGVNQTVTVIFTGGTGFFDSSNDLSHTVSPYSAGVALAADAATTVSGESLELTATITAGSTATGSVDFVATPTTGAAIALGTATINGAGVAVLTTAALPVGDYGIVASFAGSAAVDAGSSSSLAHTVGKAAVTVDVSSNVPSPEFGYSPTLTMTVAPAAPGAGTPSGTVTVSLDGTEIDTATLNGSGVATLAIAPGDAGSHAFTVAYNGDDSFATGSGSLDLTVVQLQTATYLPPFDRSEVYGNSQTYSGVVVGEPRTDPAGSKPTGTVQLFIGSFRVAEATLIDGGYTITTDLTPVQSTLLLDAWVIYLGDTNYAASDSRAWNLDTTVEMAKADVDPVLSSDPAADSVGIGSVVTLSATFPHLGAGASGTVDFYANYVKIGSGTITSDVATFEYTIASTNTTITAEYLGDSNFVASSAAPFYFIADRNGVVIDIADPGPLEYGTVFDLVATVTVGAGVTPAYHVSFQTTSGRPLGFSVPVVAGEARQTVCAGDTAGCPSGAILLDTYDDGIFASYPETATNLPGRSATLDYTLSDAATTTTVAVSSATVSPGGTVTLTATVAGATTAAVPTGHVTFYGSTPLEGGGTGNAFLGNATLVNGVATLDVVAGLGAEQLRWPADAIVADYFAGGAPFGTSSASTPVTVNRIPVTIGYPAIIPTVYDATTVSVSLSHAPGVADDYTGEVTITADTGASCSQWVPAGSNTVSCAISWPSVGAHSYTVSYSGDVVYAPLADVPTAVSVGKATPLLGASTQPQPIAEMDTTVNWDLFDASATGTITVWGNGTLWCDAVPLADTECTGQFTTGSATGSPVGVIVRYSGDANWIAVESSLEVTVKRCAVLDVRSNNSALGTVSVVTEPNCGATGYVTGSNIEVVATPTAPNEFVQWRGYGVASAELIRTSTEVTTDFYVTTDSFTWVHIADFRVPCYPVTADATGHGSVWIAQPSNCTLDNGDPGYLHGTAIAAYPRALMNPTYQEADIFYSFGTPPAGAVVGRDVAGVLNVSTTVTGPTAIPISYGPRCRTVSVELDLIAEGDVATVETLENCQSPLGNGFVRGTPVVVAATPGLSSHVLAGWSIDGVAQPLLGTTASPTVLIDRADLLVTANFVACFAVTVVVDGGYDERGRALGAAAVDGLADCPDGSDRYTAGSVLTITPEILVDGASFSGWDDSSAYLRLTPEGDTGVGAITAASREVTLNGDVTVTANFFLDSSCSRISVFGEAQLMTFDTNGCGVGYYYDLQKVLASREGVTQTEMWQQNRRTQLQVTIPDDEPLAVYANVRGDVRGCFGTSVGDPGPSTDLGWKTYGPLLPGTNECGVGGAIDVRLEACQTIRSSPEVHVIGDENVYGAVSLPETIYVPGPDGLIGSMSLGGFNWAQTVNVTVTSDTISYSEMRGGPCRDAGNAFPAGSEIALYALSPTSGFEFNGWANVFPNTLIDAIAAENLDVVLPDLLPANPMLRKVNDTDRSMPVTAAYTVTCYHLALDEGISVVGHKPTCPGTQPADNMYIAGTAVQVRAAYRVGSRVSYGFTDGVINSQVTQDAQTLDLVGFAFMDGNKTVAADYPDSEEKFARGFIQGLKISAGVFAVAAPIAIGLLFPPMGLFFAVAAAGAGIASMIPGGDKAASVFEMMNPTSITACAARWAFDNSGQTTGAYNPGAIASVAKTSYNFTQGKDIVMKPIADLRSLPLGVGAKLPDKLANFPGGLSFALAAAGFGYGLYSAGIGDAATDIQTVDQLRGTSTMTGCLDEKWRFADSNTSGN